MRPLGLWRRRAQSLLSIAKYASENEGHFPSNPREHRQIPAVGQFISNAILKFQHGQHAPLLDANMARVIKWFIHPRKLADISDDRWLEYAAHWFVRQDPREVNWAVLDLEAPFATLAIRCACPAQ